MLSCVFFWVSFWVYWIITMCVSNHLIYKIIDTSRRLWLNLKEMFEILFYSICLATKTVVAFFSSQLREKCLGQLVQHMCTIASISFCVFIYLFSYDKRTTILLRTWNSNFSLRTISSIHSVLFLILWNFLNYTIFKWQLKYVRFKWTFSQF